MYIIIVAYKVPARLRNKDLRKSPGNINLLNFILNFYSFLLSFSLHDFSIVGVPVIVHTLRFHKNEIYFIIFLF